MLTKLQTASINLKSFCKFVRENGYRLHKDHYRDLASEAGCAYLLQLQKDRRSYIKRGELYPNFSIHDCDMLAEIIKRAQCKC